MIFYLKNNIHRMLQFLAYRSIHCSTVRWMQTLFEENEDVVKGKTVIMGGSSLAEFHSTTLFLRNIFDVCESKIRQH